ncbi:MAG TPA: RNA methyltransferase, partial [Thermoanaerobaculia bacterium]|nr:RNA methyltransferase [Thermoanaerobaculia bacterium]
AVMPRLRVVLVEPREAGNVGAAARVMKNFGFEELWIVGEHPALLPVAGWWASGADDLLAAAREVPTLHEAIADAHLVVATTSARGRTTPADFTPESLARRFGALAPDETLALVFGREDSGLTREEVVLCQRTAVIPTNDRFPTMNLAQAVGAFVYELTGLAGSEAPRQLAPAAQVERLHERLEALLVEAGFLHTDNPDRIYDDIRSMLGRAELDEREVTILLGMVRQLEWAVRR